MNRKLGRKPGVVHDHRTLKLASYLPKKALSERPKSARTTRKIPDDGWGMLGNDRYGDCGPVAVYHADMAWDARLRRESASPPSLSDVLELYHFANPAFNPQTGSGDGGVYTLDLLNSWRKEGIADRGSAGRYPGWTRKTVGDREHLSAFTQIDPKDHARMEFACANFGGLIVGMLLPLSAQDTSKPWKLPSELSDDDQPGSWGGHLVYCVGYSKGYWDLVTWGAVQRASYEWLDHYGDETYCVFSADWLTKAGRTPRGFAIEKLKADLAAL